MSSLYKERILKIIAISDTHNRHKKLIMPQGDILIHSGDATGRGERGEVEAFLDWFAEQDYQERILIAGNHDWLFERQPGLAEQMCKERDITYLNNSEIIIDGVKIWGSPWTPWFYSWAFNARRTPEQAHTFGGPFIGDIWKLIPDDVNILVTHGPPYGILDEVVMVNGDSKDPKDLVGCEELSKRIAELKDLEIHVFGHIHCSHGQKHINGVSYYNASICDESYAPTNPITIIDYVKNL